MVLCDWHLSFRIIFQVSSIFQYVLNTLIPVCGRIIFHYVSLPHLVDFCYCWICELFLFGGCNKQWWFEHSYTNIDVFFFLFLVWLGVEFLGHIASLFNNLRNYQTFPDIFTVSHILITVHDAYVFSTLTDLLPICLVLATHRMV